jgi:hypothetical protein
LEVTMRKTILAAASVATFAIGSVGVGHAAITTKLGPSSSSGQTGQAALRCDPELSSSSGGNIREFGYGVPQLWAQYQQFGEQQQAQSRAQQFALSGTTCSRELSSSSGQNIREFGYGVPQEWAQYQQFGVPQIGKPVREAEHGTVRELEFRGG